MSQNPFTVEPTSWETAPADGLDLSTPLGQCCHGSHLLGRESSFVLHGGGNTSVKDSRVDITGRAVDALFVKGSGWDLASIQPEGFTPLGMDRLHELLELDELSDQNMARELAAAKLDPAAPAPSVESLLHAFLPFRAVQHSHADVIVSLTNTADGERNVRDVFGDEVVVIPYVMPGFDLARMVRERWPEQYGSHMTGMVLLNHGLFTFADETRQAYERHMNLIARAQDWMNSKGATRAGGVRPASAPAAVEPARLGSLRKTISRAAGRPFIVGRHRGADVDEFIGRPDMADLATRGPITPDHVIRTKRLPMIGTDVATYVVDYEKYFDTNQHRSSQDLTMLDPAPRVILDTELGLLTAGKTANDVGIGEDIYRHTMQVLTAAEDHLGGYVALDQGEIFDVEYWDLEQAKLALAGSPPPLAGQVALVTGSASGIGRACATALLAQGAAVIGLDLNDTAAETFDGPSFCGVSCDVTDEDAVAAAVGVGVERFGGIDIVVVAAGVFPPSELVADLDPEQWRKTMAVNVDSVASLFRQVHPLLCESPVDARVVIIASKNAPAPGPGAAAYSASKAALTQLGRVSALEWASDGIRVNMVHPDAVFDTGLWSPELIEERAAKYDMTADEYKTRNLLGTEVTSATVADAVVALCGPAFVATTGAQVPIDGGSDRVI